MQRFDLTPFFSSTVGFDRVARLLDETMRDQVRQTPSYPPYNIERLDENDYRITMAVAGFAENELEIEVTEQRLVIRGKPEHKEEGEGDQPRYLYRGIARRAFERRFDLAEHIRVTGARMENGLLHVDLVREVPEEHKPRTIQIEAGDADKARRISKDVQDSKAA